VGGGLSPPLKYFCPGDLQIKKAVFLGINQKAPLSLYAGTASLWEQDKRVIIRGLSPPNCYLLPVIFEKSLTSNRDEA
jgi:hypothetical protein